MGAAGQRAPGGDQRERVGGIGRAEVGGEPRAALPAAAQAEPLPLPLAHAGEAVRQRPGSACGRLRRRRAGRGRNMGAACLAGGLRVRLTEYGGDGPAAEGSLGRVRPKQRWVRRSMLSSTTSPDGYRYVIANGEVTFVDQTCTGAPRRGACFSGTASAARPEAEAGGR